LGSGIPAYIIIAPNAGQVKRGTFEISRGAQLGLSNRERYQRRFTERHEFLIGPADPLRVGLFYAEGSSLDYWNSF
jgi:hypothetical protein